MLSVYLACLCLGGVLLLASFFGDHSDADADVNHDLDHGMNLPFLSLRFWIFGLTFFGLSGLVLAGLGLAGPVGAAILAGIVGVGSGTTASRLLSSLTRNPVGELVANPQVGKEGQVLLPVAREERGKVRLLVRGQMVDVLAETDSPVPLPIGTTVLVVAMRGVVALVEPSALADSSLRSLSEKKERS